MLDWIKEHPYLTGGLVLASIVLYMIWRSSSTSTSSTNPNIVTTGPSDTIQAMEIQAGAAVQGAQIQSNTQIAGYNASLNAVALQQGTAQYADLLSAGVYNNQTAAALQLGLAQIGAQNPTQTTTVSSQPDYSGQQYTQTVINATTPATSAAGTVTAVPIPGLSPAEMQGSFQIPSSTGLNWNQYWSKIQAQLGPNTDPRAEQTVGAYAMAQAAAQQDYISNPLSCHNTVCTA